MIIKEGTEIGRHTEIRANVSGKVVLRVKSFNTRTKRAVLYGMITYKDSNALVAVHGESMWEGKRQVVTFACHLLGHSAYDKRTGEEIK